MDPLSDKYPSLSPFIYCAGNPINIKDAFGRDWFRNDESGSVFWCSSTADFTVTDGQRFRNIGTSYSTYKDGSRYNYDNTGQVTTITDASPRYNLEGGQYLPHSFVTDDGTTVSVTYNYHSSSGGNADKSVSKKIVSLLIDEINNANNSGANVTSIDISTSSTGKHSSSKSAHYVINGARAIDIDAVNGVPVANKQSHNQVDALQKAAKNDTTLQENFGPNIQEKNGNKIKIGGHENHIHQSTKK